LEHHIAWKTVTDKSELELLPECIEEYITLSISQKYAKLLLYQIASVSNIDECCRLYVPAKEEDWIFSSFITSIGFITPDHLDLDMTIEDVLLLSCGQNLADMNFAASPRAKLVCIADCCVKIFSAHPWLLFFSFFKLIHIIFNFSPRNQTIWSLSRRTRAA
jgi:hypothetical protein